MNYFENSKSTVLCQGFWFTILPFSRSKRLVGYYVKIYRYYVETVFWKEFAFERQLKIGKE